MVATTHQLLLQVPERPLLEVLQQRPGDGSSLLQLGGDHLTPASAGLRQNLLGTWADDPLRQRQIDRLAATIDSWWRQDGGQAERG